MKTNKLHTSINEFKKTLIKESKSINLTLMELIEWYNDTPFSSQESEFIEDAEILDMAESVYDNGGFNSFSTLEEFIEFVKVNLDELATIDSEELPNVIDNDVYIDNKLIFSFDSIYFPGSTVKYY